ncbi:MAG: hypothetical protein SCH66_13985 [Methanolobus sp.]|nr:hypothetical protein [Methanolobus sp.]
MRSQWTIFLVLASVLLGMGLASAQVSDLELDIVNETGPIENITAKEIVISQEDGGDVRWLLPGPRELDPELFGTPDAPLGFEEGIGVPVEDRNVDENGTAFTNTSVNTAFSDEYAQVNGTFQANMTDITRVDDPDSNDTAQAEFIFTDPAGENEYRLVLTQIIPVGVDHPFMGGVIVDSYLHGRTGIGTRMVPTTYAYGALWGVGDLYINGELVSDNRLVHIMATEQVRTTDDEFRLLFDDELPHEGIHTHLVLPDVAVTSEGPVQEPVPTGYMLPDGTEQPFMHVMFEDTEIQGLEVIG